MTLQPIGWQVWRLRPTLPPHGMLYSMALKVARKRLASGEIRAYYYDRASGNFLGHDRDAALAAAEADAPPAPAGGTVAAVVADYLASSRFKSLAPSTQELYGRYLDLIRREYGALPARGMRPYHVERVKVRFEATPRKANLVVVLFRIILFRAVKQGLIEANPAAKPELIPTPPRDEVWTATEEAAFMAAARPSLRLACALLAFTAQRLSDVLGMTRGHVTERDGRLFLTLRQRKTKELIELPAHRNLAPLLRARLADPSGGMMLVPSPTGLPWSRRNFSRAWDQAERRAAFRLAKDMFKAGARKPAVRAVLDEFAAKQRRDWRRTAVVRLAEAGATVPQIAAVTGWSIDYCQKIVDTYLPRRTEVATAAIDIWESAPAPRVVNLAAARRSKA